MNARPGLYFRPRACRRCGGDAYLDRSDAPEWRCLQCGRVVTQAAVLNDTALPAAVLSRRAA